MLHNLGNVFSIVTRKIVKHTRGFKECQRLSRALGIGQKSFGISSRRGAVISTVAGVIEICVPSDKSVVVHRVALTKSRADLGSSALIYYVEELTDHLVVYHLLLSGEINGSRAYNTLSKRKIFVASEGLLNKFLNNILNGLKIGVLVIIVCDGNITGIRIDKISDGEI